MEWIEVPLTWPFAEVVDGSTRVVGTAPEQRTLEQIARNYGETSENQETRTISVRLVTEYGGAGSPSNFDVPFPPYVPLENLSWNGGNPSYEGIAIVDILDDNDAHFWAINPDGWSLARAVADYGASENCTNQEPHEIQAREFYGFGSQPFTTFTVPVEEEPE